MKIDIEWFDGKYPSFNVCLATSEGKQPFITIKGCRIVDGSKGAFVSWPATKKDDGKYWNHVYASEAFNTAVMDAAMESKPKPAPRQKDERYRAGAPDDLSDIPF
jgi:DNA-binding cell septation regulator SpoVG